VRLGAAVAAGIGMLCVFTTQPKRLGLRLEPTNGKVETIVVERAEKPTPE
jgi:uncharacterized protein (TIGR03435 family)